MPKIRPAGKFLIIVALLGGLYVGYRILDNKGYLDSVSSLFKTSKSEVKVVLPKDVPDNTPIIKIGVVTWGGYAGGEYFNKGFDANKESRYFKKYNMLVSFVVIDDFITSRDAWKHGDIDVLWTTADAFPTETEGLAKHHPKVIFQADWSRGGDAIVVRRGIDTANQLIGKKVTFAAGTPSHTFFIQMMKAAGLDYNQVEIIPAQNAIDAAAIFKAGKVDAAVVWSPDDEDCVKSVPGSKVLQSSRTASNIIADVFFAKEDFINNHKTELRNLIEGWLIGAGEINSSNAAKQEAAQILSVGLKQPFEFCLNAINNARLTTYGDNVNFFNLNGDYRGVKGEDLYRDMTDEYTKVKLASSDTPQWRAVVDTSLLNSIHLEGMENEAENGVQFNSPAKGIEISRKAVTVNFQPDSSTLSPEEQDKIQREFGGIAQRFARNRVKIEGNTDVTGDRVYNISLSQKRANSVAHFLAQTYGFDSRRFIIVGHGPDKPVCVEDTDACYAKNRRTDFVLTE